MRLFDSNAHPDHAGDDGYEDYVATARQLGFVGACAVGLPGTDAAEHFDRCRRTGFLTPVAPWEAAGLRRQRQHLRDLHGLGYTAVKVHPRWGGPAIGSREFRGFLTTASELGMAVFVCTYPFGPANRGLGDRILEDLERAIQVAPAARMVLLHGGAVDLLRYIEFCRANDHLLLDLSYTLVKYQGSSLDADLSFAFQNFDRRICVGTDHPYESAETTIARLEHFLDPLDSEKRANVLHRNLMAYLGVGSEPTDARRGTSDD